MRNPTPRRCCVWWHGAPSSHNQSALTRPTSVPATAGFRSDQCGMIGAESRLLIGAGADPEHQRRLVVPPVRGAEQSHPQLLTYPGRSLVVWMGHGPDLLKLKCETSRQQRASGLGRQSAAPAIGMQVPSDLDLAGAVGQGLRLGLILRGRDSHAPRPPSSRTVDRRPADPACVE